MNMKKRMFSAWVFCMAFSVFIGQILAAGDTITEDTGRTVPVTLDFAGQTEYSTGTFEFCIGHGDPADQVMSGDPVFGYFLLGEKEFSRNECVMSSS